MKRTDLSDLFVYELPQRPFRFFLSVIFKRVFAFQAANGLNWSSLKLKDSWEGLVLYVKSS